MAQGESPTVGRLLLGIRLRKLRQSKDVSADQAANHVTRAPSAITRFEKGQTAVPAIVLGKLLDLYEASAEERDALNLLARRARQSGWWEQFGDVLPMGFETYVGLESEADELRTYQCQVVPGLLQSERYAEALMRAEPHPATEEEVGRRVQARMVRKEILSRDEPAHLYAVLDEAVLRRQVGGREIMHEQVTYLLNQARQRNIMIQVLTNELGAHAAMFGAFMLVSLDLGEPTLSEYAYIEHRTGSLLLDKRQETAVYRACFDEVRAEALDRDKSLSVLAAIADGYKIK
ncbi:helix-turn-helix domain-containing protein [Spirillospora sp. NPDC048911]|uniref:helix-turn-helix domain-containing protein n=1 Tax=Spirillospora sp. NPDC048911 TaxID=3364527 RepID=UPI0037130B13